MYFLPEKSVRYDICRKNKYLLFFEYKKGSFWIKKNRVCVCMNKLGIFGYDENKVFFLHEGQTYKKKTKNIKKQEGYPPGGHPA